MADTAVSGYLDIWGKHGAWVGDHTGPASYATGGESISACPKGLRSLDFMGVEEISYSGNYLAKVVSPIGSGGSAQARKLRWFYNDTAPVGTPLILGPLSAAATQSVYTTNGVATVTGANTLSAGQFVLLTNGATAFGIFLDGVIVQITAATPTSYSFNFGPAKALHYAVGTDTLKYQVIYGGSASNPVTLGDAPGQSIAVTAVAVASDVLTITCVNTGITVVPGNFIVLQGLAAGEVPQGAIVQVIDGERYDDHREPDCTEPQRRLRARRQRRRFWSQMAMRRLPPLRILTRSTARPLRLRRHHRARRAWLRSFPYCKLWQRGTWSSFKA